MENIFWHIPMIGFAFLITGFLSLLIHKTKGFNKANISLQLHKEPFSFIFHDYFFREIFINDTKTSEGRLNRKKEIIYANIMNLALSCGLFIIVLLLDHQLSVFLLYIILIRTMSRTFEVIFISIKDVLSICSRSVLSKYDRVKLAFNSYLELFIMYTSLYFIMDVVINGGRTFGFDLFKALKYTLGIQSLVNSDNFVRIRSISVTTSIIGYLQVFAVITLIIITVMKYIEMGDKKMENTKVEPKKNETNSTQDLFKYLMVLIVAMTFLLIVVSTFVFSSFDITESNFDSVFFGLLIIYLAGMIGWFIIANIKELMGLSTSPNEEAYEHEVITCCQCNCTTDNNESEAKEVDENTLPIT